MPPKTKQRGGQVYLDLKASDRLYNIQLYSDFDELTPHEKMLEAYLQRRPDFADFSRDRGEQINVVENEELEDVVVDKHAVETLDKSDDPTPQTLYDDLSMPFDKKPRAVRTVEGRTFYVPKRQDTVIFNRGNAFGLFAKDYLRQAWRTHRTVDYNDAQTGLQYTQDYGTIFGKDPATNSSIDASVARGIARDYKQPASKSQVAELKRAMRAMTDAVQSMRAVLRAQDYVEFTVSLHTTCRYKSEFRHKIKFKIQSDGFDIERPAGVNPYGYSIDYHSADIHLYFRRDPHPSDVYNDIASLATYWSEHVVDVDRYEMTPFLRTDEDTVRPHVDAFTARFGDLFEIIKFCKVPQSAITRKRQRTLGGAKTKPVRGGTAAAPRAPAPSKRSEAKPRAPAPPGALPRAAFKERRASSADAATHAEQPLVRARAGRQETLRGSARPAVHPEPDRRRTHLRQASHGRVAT